MKSPFLKFVVLWCSLSSALFASRSDVINYFNLLKKIPKNEVSVKGQVCEKVAMLQLMNQYSPDRYTIIPNVTYGVGKVMMGELDLLVMEKTNHKVKLVLEVKCRRDLKKSAKKAVAQLKRIKSFTDPILGYLTDPDEDMEISDSESSGEHEGDWYIHFEIEEQDGEDQEDFLPVFDTNTSYLAMSPLVQTKKSFGFVPLDLTFDEVDLLTAMLQYEDEETALRYLNKKYK